jgi:hypothetical protein
MRQLAEYEWQLRQKYKRIKRMRKRSCETIDHGSGALLQTLSNFMELPDMFAKAYLVGKLHKIKRLRAHLFGKIHLSAGRVSSMGISSGKTLTIKDQSL